MGVSHRENLTAWRASSLKEMSINTSRKGCGMASSPVPFRSSLVSRIATNRAVSPEFYPLNSPKDYLFTSESPHFNTAIVNPLYRKIRSDSAARLLLRSAGIEAGNLYAGFVALMTRLLVKDGELVG